MKTTVTLLDDLRHSAAKWCAENEATPARLGRTVINDGGYFDRIVQPDAGTTTSTLEKFAVFLGEPGNWPAGEVPPGVRAFVRRVRGPSPQEQAAFEQRTHESTSAVDDDMPDWAMTAQAEPEEADMRIVICAVCEHRLDDQRIRACQAGDCPHAQQGGQGLAQRLAA